MRLPHPLRHRVVPLAMILLTGCVSKESAAPAAPAPTPEQIAAGLQPAVQFLGEEPMRYGIEERLAHYTVPGVSVAVLDGDTIAWARGWGVADRETGAAVTPETLFQAASISKPVGALVALGLVDDGTLALDAPVNDYLTSWNVPDNEFTADSAVTLRGLLTHSAGLTVWGFPGYRKDQPFAEGRAVATNPEVLDGAGNTPEVRVYKVPGTSWQYSGGGFTIMEQLVEDVTGLPFDEVARSRVLAPAGMERSTFAQPLPEGRWSEAARGHRGGGSEVEGEWHTYPEQAAAGLWTTPTDLLTLSAHLLGILNGTVVDGVLSRPALEAMLTPHHPGDSLFANWGLGIGLQGDGAQARFGHGGSNEGFRAQWTVLRNAGKGVAVMTNGDAGSPLTVEIIRSVASAYGWDVPELEPEVRPRVTPDSAALAEYAGTYQAEGRAGLVVEVRAGDGVLEADIPGRGTVTLHASVDPVDGFFNRGTGESVRFGRDEDGRVGSVQSGSGPRFVRRP